MPNAKQNLVIVESPSKAKTIGKYLGPDYQVKASMGHLRDLPKSTLSVDIEHDFEPEYYPLKGKEEIISELQKAAKQRRPRLSRNRPGPRRRGHLLAPEISAVHPGRCRPTA